jgi:hypothetical protein
VEEGGEEEEEVGAGRGRGNYNSIRGDCASSIIGAERETPEPQSPVAVPAEASDIATDSSQTTPQNVGFDATQEVRLGSESGGSDTRSTRADGSEEASKTDNPLTCPEPSKRKRGDLETDMREPKSRRKRPSKVPRKSQPAFKEGSKVRHKTYSPPKSSESFSDLTEISQKVLEPDDVHEILAQRSDEKYHHRLGFLTRLFFAIASPRAFKTFKQCVFGGDAEGPDKRENSRWTLWSYYSKDNMGRTPLSRAARYGYMAVVKLLLAKDRVDPESKDNWGWTPLWRPEGNGHEAVVKLLTPVT